MVGVVLGSHIPPKEIASAAREAEEYGFDQIWLAEDCWFTGAIAGAGIALAATRRPSVGFGVVSALTRHPAVLAMEIATLSQAYEGRVMAGIGVGFNPWLVAMGIAPTSDVSTLVEAVTIVRGLLNGGTVNLSGSIFKAENISLAYPADGIEIYCGVGGPRKLREAGRHADGWIVPAFCDPAYVGWGINRLQEGRSGSKREENLRVITYAMYSVDEDGDVARQAIRPLLGWYLSIDPEAVTARRYGISSELKALAAKGPSAVADQMPDQWIMDLAVAGTPSECADKIMRYHEAGADVVALYPVPADRTLKAIRLTGDEVRPRLAEAGPR